MNKFIKFFVKPTSTTKKLESIEDTQKYVIIFGVLLFSAIISSYNIMFGFNFSFVGAFINILTHFLLAVFIFGIGKIFGAKWSFINTVFFILLSDIIFLLWYGVGNFVGLAYMMIPFMIGLIWFLVLLSKSLSQVGKVSESKITIIVILAVVALWGISSYLIAPLTGVSLF